MAGVSSRSGMAGVFIPGAVNTEGRNRPMKKIFTTILMSLFLSGPAYAADIKKEFHVSQKLLSSGVVQQTAVYKGDKYVPNTYGPAIFNTFIYERKIIAITWQNQPLINMDIFPIVETELKSFAPNISKEFMNYSGDSARVVLVLDMNKTKGVNDALYVPTMFPKGFTVNNVITWKQ